MFTEFPDTPCNGAVCNIMEKSWNIACILIWIVGVLGNLLNILIFSHKNMQSPINSILWWLAVSDLIQLLVIALYGWCCGWCPYIDFFFPGPIKNPFYVSVLFLISIYLLQVFHSITIGLNVILALWRYKYLAMANSIRRKFRGDSRSVRKIVLFQYLLSFLTGSLVFYAMKIHDGMDENSYVVYYRPSNVKNDSAEIVDDVFVEVCTITYGFILRVVPLILLTVISVKQIFWLSKDRRTRKLSTASAVIGTQRYMDRVNTLIAWILFMFVIVEIPFAGSGVLRVLSNFLHLPETIIISKKILRYVQKLSLLISSSCNIFYYLVLCTPYRDTMKLFLCNIGQNRQIHTSQSVTIHQVAELVEHEIGSHIL